MWRLIVLLAALMLPQAAIAQTVSVILNAGATAVLVPAPADQGQVYNPPATIINTSDARWTNYLGLQGSGQTASSLLVAGIAMTFTVTTGASGSYCAAAADVQSLDHVWTGKVAIGANATFPVPVCAGSATTHTMAQLAFKDLYADVIDYNTKVLAAQATAVANQTTPVWPSNAYTSTH